MSETRLAETHVRLSLESGYRFRISFDAPAASAGGGLVTDEPPPLGEGSGPNPLAMLATAVGSCLASSLLFCVRKARLEPRGMEVDVEVVTARNPQGRLRVERIEARLAPGFHADELARLGRCHDLFESFCTVTESVRAGIPVNVMMTPVRIEAGAAVAHV
jgi:organic hydroperoxide reductase OsmC/OhrA